MQPYAGASPLPIATFRPNGSVEIELDQDALMICYARSDHPTDRVPLAGLQELEIVGTTSLPGVGVAIILLGVFASVAIAVGAWGLLDPRAASATPAFLFLGIFALGAVATFFRDRVLLVGWEGRRRTEKFPKRREAEARRFIEAVTARRALVAPPPPPPPTPEPPKPS